MTQEEFKALEPGAMFIHPAFPGEVFVVEAVETDFDYSTKPGIRFTCAVTTTESRRMKINDSDVGLCSLVSNPR